MKKGLLLVFALFAAFSVFSQVKLSNGSSSATLDFSNAMPTSVGSNPSTAFTAAGFEPNTATAGRLNSNAWAVTGWSNGALAFGGTQITASTDYTRGATAAAQTTGGMYAFTGAPQSAANPCLMIQPGGSDWAPGTVTLKIENTGTTNITALDISYNLYNRNDQARSNSFNFSHSNDDITYTNVPALDFTSPAALDALGWVLIGSAPSRSTTITGLSVAPGAFYYIRWSGADVGGSGSRDEFGLDDIGIEATFACDLEAAGLADVHCEDNNETDNNPTDDFIWFQLNPTGDGLGSGYNVTVSPGSVLWNGTDPATNVPYGNSEFFRLQQGSAGAGDVTVSIEDADDPNCTFDVMLIDPGSCSPASACSTDSGLSDIACNDNDTPSDALDDFITFFLNPSGSFTPTYSIVFSFFGNIVTLMDGSPATGVPYGVQTQFRFQNGSAGGGNDIIVIQDDNNPFCNIFLEIADPGECSTPVCDLTDAGLTDVHCEDNNETDTDPTDDFIWFQLNPTGVGLGSNGYNVTVSSGSVLWNGNTAPNNVPYGNLEFFRLQQGSAGAGNVTIFIADADDADCVFSIEIEDPGSCSVSNCDIEITNIEITHETCPGDNDGSITITATCTTCEDIEYSIDGTNWFPSGVFTGLAPGSYSVFVRDTENPDCSAGGETAINPGDGEPPYFEQDVLPQDATIECSEDVPDAEVLTALDLIDDDVPVAFDEQNTPGSCPQEYTITRTWTATDDCGNSAQHTQTITVEDNTPPVLNGLPDISLSLECDEALPDVPEVTATDLCDTDVPVMFTESTEPGGCPQEYTLYRTWTATDDCGNAVTFTQTITVTDDTAPTFNQDPLPQDITVSCSAIPMPEMLDGTDNCDPGVPVPVIFINEIHYDNAGTDAGEFIEVAGTAGIDLSNYQIVLYNGAGGAPYGTMLLSGLIDNEAGGFGAVSFPYPVNGIQNGAPDGIALATTSGMVIQFLSYEGTFTAMGGVANGMLSTDIGVLELGTEPVGNSLQLTGAGQEYDDFTWVGPIAQSPGTLNAGQTLNPLPGVIAAMFSQMIEAGDCNGEATITRIWELRDACGNAITHTQIITVEDTEGPAFSPPPLPMDITLSCEQPVPPAPDLTAADLCDVPGMMMERVWINEIHYDNTGGDAGEFVEIAGTAGTDLANYTLILYNGNDGAPYNTMVLGGIIPNQANGFGTVCFNYAVNGIQNGAPDGMALVHNVMGGMVIQFLSYEGAFVAVGGAANGMMSTDIGVDEEPAPAAGNSIYLTGNGDEYSDFSWTGPLAATNCGVNTGQTFIAMSMGPIVTFEETSEPGACPQEGFIYRTWTATDNCGNATTLNQTITIVDDTPPTVNCPANITLNLDIFGNAQIDIDDLNITYSDNCADEEDLEVVPFPTQFFDCDDEGTTVQVVVSVEDPCGNIGTCTTNVFIAPFSRCTPVILITDPCVCKNNATTLENGQFSETIKIESLAGKTWTVIANTGLYSTGSPAPPFAPFLIPVGTTFTENPVPSGDYYLTGIHVDALGYSITVRSETGQILVIGNACEYPNPTITSDLDGPFCLFSDPVDLTGTPGDANILSEGFTVNGVPATEFDPSQGVGQYHIVYTVNGGVPKAFGPDDPGCIQSVGVFVNVLATPTNLVCNDLVYLSLSADCEAEITPDMVLEGSYACFDDYLVEIDRTLPYGNGPWEPAFVNANDIGRTYAYRVTHLVSGNKCWGDIKIEDKLAPVMSCANFSVLCNTSNLTPDYLFNTLHILEAFPIVTDCQNFTLSYIDTETPQDCASGLTNIITRKWTAVDASGNTSICFQTIGQIRPTLANDLILPLNYDGVFAPGFNCTDAYPTPDWIESQDRQGYPYVFNVPVGCNINWTWHDFKIEICDGTYKIRREWTVIDWCTGEILIHNQFIKVVDEQGPDMTCPPNTTVSIDPFQCCGTIDLPNIIIEDNCSQVNNISGMVATFDPFTNEPTGMYTFGGTLQDFPGNNWWDRDTLAAFGFTPCLPTGTQTVTYRAQDDCGNTTTCTFTLKIEDLIPPVAACDQLTQVALSADGMAFVNASTFDDGSYDLCAPVYFKVRRMNSNSCQSNGEFYDQVKFCCEDIGDTVLVVFRVYDVAVPAGDVSTTFQDDHANDCMVQVLVEDKIKPSCAPPANVTVDCENFDPSLWAYGTAEAIDNCCIDNIINTASYTLFDTVCNKGTINRTFRVFDCAGNVSQCSQRVVVQYLQDYFLRFPNDAIVTVCDDSARYDEPKLFGEDCELLGISYEDEIFAVVPDACFKIERTWTVINWCTYNPNLDCIYVPNPNPNPAVNHASNLPGPTISACGTPPPWKSTIVKINPTDPVATDFCTFWEANANCYKYKQIIKVIDGQPPTIERCPSDTTYCDLTPNDPGLWNSMDWWDAVMQTHDLCEGPADLGITGKDACSGPNIMAHYLLFLDLDNDGDMETVVNSLNPPPPGIVYFGNAYNPNYSGGTPRQFDVRGLPLNQNYQFSLLQRFNTTGTKRMFSVRWNTQQFPNVYTVPEFPHGTHKIKWIVEDGCGNQTFCEYTFTVKDCKAPTVVCLNGLSVNIMPTGMITLWASDFLQYTEDNCTPSNQIKIGIRKCGEGTGFPTNPDGTPQTSVTFTCDEQGTQCVELWAIDAAGNADYCETYVIVQDNLGNCDAQLIVAGVLKTEISDGVEEAIVSITGDIDLTDMGGAYDFSAPIGSTFAITPAKDDNPLNGVTTYDLVLISKHILGTEPLNSPYKMIAADANKSGSITTFDIVELRKLILGIYTELPSNTSWRFVDKAFAFPNVNNPFQTPFPETILIVDAMTDQLNQDFVGLKVGDVNNTAVANATMVADDRTTGTALFDLEDREVKAGEEFEVSFKAAEALKGFQFTLSLDGLTALGTVDGENVTASNFNLSVARTAAVSIDGAQEFTLRFRAEKSGRLSEMLGVSGSMTRAEAYAATNHQSTNHQLTSHQSTNQPVTKLGIALRFDGKVISGLGFELYQNQPNPFVNKTSIGFHLPEAAEATLSIFDETGRTVYQQKGQFAKGENAIQLDRTLLNTTGVLYYKLETATDSATKKMIQAK